jgi:hypothetical protein
MPLFRREHKTPAETPAPPTARYIVRVARPGSKRYRLMFYKKDVTDLPQEHKTVTDIFDAHKVNTYYGNNTPMSSDQIVARYKFLCAQEPPESPLHIYDSLTDRRIAVASQAYDDAVAYAATLNRVYQEHLASAQQQDWQAVALSLMQGILMNHPCGWDFKTCADGRIEVVDNAGRTIAICPDEATAAHVLGLSDFSLALTSKPTPRRPHSLE